MPAILSKIRNWMYNVRHFFIKLLNRLQSFVLRNQKSDQKAIKLFWIEDRRIKICEEIFAIDLAILAYLQRSKPSCFDEKLQKFMKEKKDLVLSWRNPTLPDTLDDLPADADRRRELCVQRAERCKQLYDDLAGYKKLYNETVDQIGVVLTYNEKIHLTKPYSLFDPTCTCCFLEIIFHFPPLAPPKSMRVGVEDVTSETAPLLDNEVIDYHDDEEVEEQILIKSNMSEQQSVEDEMEKSAVVDEAETEQPEQQQPQTEFFSPMSRISNDTFQSCEPFESDFDEMHTIRSGSISTLGKQSSNDALEDDGDASSDETWNAEDADGESSSSSSGSEEGSVHMGEDSSDEDAAVGIKSDDEYIGGDGNEDDAAIASKENELISKEFSNSSSNDHPPTSSFRD